MENNLSKYININVHGPPMYPYFGDYILKILPTLTNATKKAK